MIRKSNLEGGNIEEFSFCTIVVFFWAWYLNFGVIASDCIDKPMGFLTHWSITCISPTLDSPTSVERHQQTISITFSLPSSGERGVNNQHSFSPVRNNHRSGVSASLSIHHFWFHAMLPWWWLCPRNHLDTHLHTLHRGGLLVFLSSDIKLGASYWLIGLAFRSQLFHSAFTFDLW